MANFIENLLAGVASAVDSFLGLFGASGLIKQLHGRKYTLNDFEHDWGRALSIAKSKGTRALQLLQNKIDALPQLPSGTIRNAVFKARKSLNDAMNNANKQFELANAVETGARNRAAQEEATTSMVASVINKHREGANKEANEAVQQYENVEKAANDASNYY